MRGAILAADLVSCIFSVIILYGLNFELKSQIVRNRFFNWAVIINTLAMIAEVVIYSKWENEIYGARVFFTTVVYVAPFIVYTFSFLFIYYYLMNRNALCAKLAIGVSIIAIIFGFITLCMCVAGKMFVYLDGIYYVGSAMKVCMVLTVILFALMLAVVIMSAKDFGVHDFLAFFVFIAFPIVAINMNVYDSSWVFGYPARTVSFFIIYVMIVAEHISISNRNLENARVQAMVSQIQPHFLYNSLNSIVNLCYTDGEQAAEALVDFSDYLRANLELNDSDETIPFDKELEHIKNYLRLEQLRMGERLDVEIETEYTHFEIPPLSIQPLVENAVKHGIAKKVEGGTVRILTRRTDSSILIVIEDDGVGFDERIINKDGSCVKEDGRKHYGMRNIFYRLKMCSKATITIDSKLGIGTVVTVTIPVKHAKLIQQ